MLDDASFCGALVHAGDLELRGMNALGAIVAKLVHKEPSLQEALARDDGRVLALVVRGALRVGGVLNMSGVYGPAADDPESEESFPYCLAVHGDLVAEGIRLSSPGFVSGDVHARVLVIDDADGATLHCGGKVHVPVFIHAKNVHSIPFSTLPMDIAPWDERIPEEHRRMGEDHVIGFVDWLKEEPRDGFPV